MRELRRLRRRVSLARPRRETGAAAVEFALVLPILAMLLLGSVTAGITYSHGIGLSNAVREGSRFGATSIVTPLPATPATWVDDVITRVRTTQFDDPDQNTAVCVVLTKQGTALPVVSKCSQGNFGAPALSTADPAFPTVPVGVPTGTCVVRVLAARKYSITLGVLPALSGTMKRGSVARFERSAC